MALVSNTYFPIAQSNFSIRNGHAPNREGPLTSGHIVKQDVGSSSTVIPPTFLYNHSIFMSPTGAANSTIQYSLPTASQILNEFGRSVDTGAAKIVPGSVQRINFVNRGTNNAVVVANTTGGDGSAVWCSTGASSVVNTGAAGKYGKVTTLYLEWLNVNSGVNGATGDYTIYA